MLLTTITSEDVDRYYASTHYWDYDRGEECEEETIESYICENCKYLINGEWCAKRHKEVDYEDWCSSWDKTE